MITDKGQKLVKIPKMKKILKIVPVYLWKRISNKPIIFNLNINATNLCNQNCPMCNAVIVGKGKGNTITLEQFKNIYNALKPYNVASLTLSGGEPSLAKDMPEIIEFASGKFPFGINLNTNLFANEKIITRVATSALKCNARIGTSFDGIGELADKLRGVKNVSQRVIENIELVSELKKKYNSSSILSIHTVISDKSISQVPDILKISEKYGWKHTLAPVNNFFYQEDDNVNFPKLHYSKELEEIINIANSKENIGCSREFLKSIPKFTKGEIDKFCPYLTKMFGTYKVFVDPDGNLALCNREPIGNVLESSIEDILKTEKYKSDYKAYKKCQGCWMICFVEVLLAMPKFYRNMIKNRF